MANKTIKFKVTVSKWHKIMIPLWVAQRYFSFKPSLLKCFIRLDVV